MLNIKLILSILLQVLLLSFTNICFAQEQLSFNVSENTLTADLNVKIVEDLMTPDIAIKIGKDVIVADFTVGITTNRFQADFIITNSILTADYSINVDPNIMVPDLTIKVGDIIIPDVTIQIKTSGTVDWIVYTEKQFITLNDLIIALLPVINLKTNHEHEILNDLFRK